jgi:hypothetical protein
MKKMSKSDRKDLKNKMAKALTNQIKPLSAPLRDILLDDLITALENRLAVLEPQETNVTCFGCDSMKVYNQKIPA